MGIDERFIRPRLVEVGRIRTGISPEAAGQKFPVKLDGFRFTSAARYLLEDLSSVYGGEVVAWQHPSRGRQVELITGADQIDVLLPKQSVESWFEMYGAKASLQRRCTGSRVVNLNQSCLCDPQGTMARDDPNRQCKITTKIQVVLAAAVGVNVFTYVSHGWNFVDQMYALKPVLDKMDDGAFWGARLKLEKQTSNVVTDKGMQAKNYQLVNIYFDQSTARALQPVADAMQALMSTGGTLAISGGTTEPQKAIEQAETLSEGDAPKVDDADRKKAMAGRAIEEIRATTTIEALYEVRARVLKAGLNRGPYGVVDAWNARKSELDKTVDVERMSEGKAVPDSRIKAQATIRPVKDVQLPPEPAGEAAVIVGEVVDGPVGTAERGPEPDRDAMYAEIVKASDVPTSQLNARIRKHAGREKIGEVDGWQLKSFLDALSDGMFDK